MSSLKLYIPEDDFLNKLNWPGEVEDITPFAVLPSIPGRIYVIGSTYPGDRENVEFIFYQWKGLVSPTQCRIYVDKEGKFWISGESETLKTFVNRQPLEEPRVLKDKDSISFGMPRKFNESKTHCPVMLARLKQIASESNETFDILESPEINPLNNDLIITSVFKYLTIRRLKRCRLVSKIWNQEASKLLEKLGTVSFNFLGYYDIPKYSMRVYKYLGVPRNLNIKNLKLTTPPSYRADNEGSLTANEKRIHDFKKLLQSKQEFTSLTINTLVRCSSTFSDFFQTLATYATQLLELKFGRNFEVSSCLPEHLQFPTTLEIPQLRKFSDETKSLNDINPILQGWIAFLVPLISKGLEDFSCDNTTSRVYLKEFVNTQPTMLKHIKINGVIGISEIQSLLQLNEMKVKSLRLETVLIWDQESVFQISKLLEKHASSLIQLEIGVIVEDIPIYFLLPPFPNLRELVFRFTSNVQVRWTSGKINYNLHFPMIQKLKVEQLHFLDQAKIKQRERNGLFEWEEDESVFNSFFPDSDSTICTTITELTVPSLDKEKIISGEEYIKYHSRLFRLPKMFPKIELRGMEGLGLTQKDYIFANDNTREQWCLKKESSCCESDTDSDDTNNSLPSSESDFDGD